jgi:hypothetical protein
MSSTLTGGSRRQRQAGTVSVGLAYGAALAWLLVIQPEIGTRAFALKIVPPAPRIQFKIDATAPLESLLPVPPVLAEPISPWLVNDLAEVPEVLFQKALPDPKDIVFQKGEFEVKGFGPNEGELKDTEKRMLKIAQGIARINHINKKGTDHCLKLMMKDRPRPEGLALHDGRRLPAAQGSRPAVRATRGFRPQCDGKSWVAGKPGNRRQKVLEKLRVPGDAGQAPSGRYSPGSEGSLDANPGPGRRSAAQGPAQTPGE